MAVDRLYLVEGAVDQVAFVEQDDLVALLAVVGENVLQGRQITQIGHVSAELFHEFALNGPLAALAELDRAAQWPVEELVLD